MEGDAFTLIPTLAPPNAPSWLLLGISGTATIGEEDEDLAESLAVSELMVTLARCLFVNSSRSTVVSLEGTVLASPSLGERKLGSSSSNCNEKVFRHD